MTLNGDLDLELPKKLIFWIPWPQNYWKNSIIFYFHIFSFFKIDRWRPFWIFTRKRTFGWSFFFVAAYFIKLYVDPNILSKNGNFVIPVTIILLALSAIMKHGLLSSCFLVVRNMHLGELHYFFPNNGIAEKKILGYF